jgi:hypothetical protein
MSQRMGHLQLAALGYAACAKKKRAFIRAIPLETFSADTPQRYALNWYRPSP